MNLIEYIVAGLCVTGLTAVFGALWRKISKLDASNLEMFAASDKKSTYIASILTGPDGSNGVRGNVTQIIADVKELKTAQTKQAQDDAVWRMGIEMRIASLEKKS